MASSISRKHVSSPMKASPASNRAAKRRNQEWMRKKAFKAFVDANIVAVHTEDAIFTDLDVHNTVVRQNTCFVVDAKTAKHLSYPEEDINVEEYAAIVCQARHLASIFTMAADEDLDLSPSMQTELVTSYVNSAGLKPFASGGSGKN